MRIALIHYWLVTWRGGEQVLRAIADLYPQADIFTHVADPALVAEHFPGRVVRRSFISRLPGAQRRYQSFLPLMPMALEQLDLRDYDLVISSESGPAKGVITAPYATHVCYCHSPMRYAWDMYHDYTGGRGRLARTAMMPLLHYMRTWDQVSAQRVDAFAANSAFVAQRIRKYYGRSSRVIHPPVAVERFSMSPIRDDFFLWVGQLVSYKRPDVAIEAFNRLGKQLIVIGDGEMRAALQRAAKPNITFLGKQPPAVLRDHYARCRALIFPGVEDFGMVPVEAMASGAPVIALGKGGALETVVDGITGMLYRDGGASGLASAVEAFCASESRFDASAISSHAARFSAESFKSQFVEFVRESAEIGSQTGRTSD